MPRYVIERNFPSPLEIPVTAEGATAMAAIVDRNLEFGVTWVHSYVDTDRTRTVCVYDGPSPEAIRQAARANELPVDAIREVRVLDPYFFTGGA
ncbi:MAG: DUF4242 domain-containing protein [Actinomycetota bacterium]